MLKCQLGCYKYLVLYSFEVRPLAGAKIIYFTDYPVSIYAIGFSISG